MAERIVVCEMTDEMRDEALLQAGMAAESNLSEVEISNIIKTVFDSKFSPSYFTLYLIFKLNFIV